MFGLFSKKEKGLKVIDWVWISDDAKFKACAAFKKDNPDVLFVAWFDDTLAKAQRYFKENNIDDKVYLANELTYTWANQTLIFLEHHPLIAEEEKKVAELGKTEITVCSSLTEPIFQSYGGDRIIALMQKMGMKDDEMISHSMVSDSIKRAQQSIAENLINPGSSRSQEDWLSNAGKNQKS